MIEVRVRNMEEDDGRLLGYFRADQLRELVASFDGWGLNGVGREWSGQYETWGDDRVVFAILHDVERR